MVFTPACSTVTLGRDTFVGTGCSDPVDFECFGLLSFLGYILLCMPTAGLGIDFMVEAKLVRVAAGVPPHFTEEKCAFWVFLPRASRLGLV